MEQTSVKKSPPWRRQRTLKLQAIPHQERILAMANSFERLEDKALFIMAYLTGGRISEIVKCPYLWKNIYKKELIHTPEGLPKLRIVHNNRGSPIIECREKVNIFYPGVCKKDIIFTKVQEKEIMVITLQNRKNKEFTLKNLPVPISKEKWFIAPLILYMEKLGDNDPLFPFQKGEAERKLAKVNMNPHFLRDIRLTHLVIIYNFNAFQLTKFAGWKDISPAEKYVRLGINDLIANF